MIPILHKKQKQNPNLGTPKNKMINYNIISEFIQKYKRIFYIYILGSLNIEQDVLGGNYICFAFVEALFLMNFLCKLAAIERV
ncbi:hypothetical protein ACJX0J_015472, partial [Zea mays]